MSKAINITLVLFLSVLQVSALAQAYELTPAGSKAVITGTSSIHDWEMDLTRFNSGFQVNMEGNILKGINNVTFSGMAKDLKSNSSIMDKKAYDALKSDKFPEIRFSGSSITGLVSEGNTIKGTLNGRLSLAGQTRDVTVPFTGTVNGSSINIKSTAELTFSEFGMEPPTAMLGTLKTGDKVKVNFNLQYQQK